MKTLFTIGETAKLMGISVQALRYYNKRGVLNPSYINPDSGYRYYSYKQLHFINRIKYLQSLGLSLSEIADIICSDDIGVLLERLNALKEQAALDLRSVQNRYEDINWYIDYFSLPSEEDIFDLPYCKCFSQRYILASPISGPEAEASAYLTLNNIKNDPAFRELNYYLWHVYLLDFSSLCQKKIINRYIGLFLKDTPGFSSPHILEVPKGKYICIKGHIRKNEWDPQLMLKYFQGRPEPDWLLACEYENSLSDFEDSVFEIQALYRQTP